MFPQEDPPFYKEALMPNIRLIVRADDLGYSEAVNYGIEKSIKDGIVHSVGLMPNKPQPMGSGFWKAQASVSGSTQTFAWASPVPTPA